MKLAYHCAHSPTAQALLKDLVKTYGQVPLDEAEVLIAIGGDGSMLHSLHMALDNDIPVYGINRGSVGFLMNHPNGELEHLEKTLSNAHRLNIHPLVLEVASTTKALYAFNEVALLREEHQAIKLKISVDGKVRLPELIGDGCLIATPVGSTAYNYSAGGPILPITSNLLSLTPLSPFRPRRWSGALLPQECVIDIEVMDAENRPVSVSADYQEVRDIHRVRIFRDSSKSVTLLYNAQETLEERSIAEQFMV